MIHIENLTINLKQGSDTNNSDEELDTLNTNEVMEELVSTLRIISRDKRLINQQVLIPEDCEQYGFAEGSHDLPSLLYFLADMLE